MHTTVVRMGDYVRDEHYNSAALQSEQERSATLTAVMGAPRVRPIILLLVLPSRCTRLGCGSRARCGAAPRCSRSARSRSWCAHHRDRRTSLVQALVPKVPVEGLEEGVVHGLAGSDEVELDAAAVRPGVEGGDW